MYHQLMRLTDLRAISLRHWVLAVVGGVALACAVSTTAWTVRHASAVYELNRGVGDTVFLDADGRPWFPLDERRRDVSFEQISTYFKDAVIAIEDHRFYLHPGVDPVALGRALLNNLRAEGGRQGGSTITQQLARTLFLSNSRTYGRKVKEAVLAVMLEVMLTKREILQLYMNRVYLSGGIYGVEAMSQAMLGKPASELALAEAALIAGIIRAPAPYSPWLHFDEARGRSFVVLRRMREEGKITAEQEHAAREAPIGVQPPPALSSARHGYAKQYLRQQFRSAYGDDNPPNWTVQTTFVPEIQDAAESAVREGLRRLGIPGLQAALVAMDPETGDLLAMVGGGDFAASSFNRAVRAHRQPGSAFKPFVYAAALGQGLSPVSTIGGLKAVSVAAPQGVWIPRDDQLGDQDELTLRAALVESSNAAAVLLQQQVGSGAVLRLAGDLGVEEQPDVPSLSLGSGLVTPLDLTAAYAVFPSLGYRVRPRGIVSVHDASDDRVLQMHVERQRVLSPQVAFQMSTILQDVVDRGTGSPARRLGVAGPVGGKTGSTNDYRDAWFVGFSSSVVVGVWVGFDQPARIRQGGSGARVALPIWSDFMRRVAGRRPPEPLDQPPHLQSEQLCLLSYQRAVEGCPTYVEYFKDGDERPTRLCPIHAGGLKQQVQHTLRGLFGSLARSIGGIFR
jgi:1A family penicillin-binding protein